MEWSEDQRRQTEAERLEIDEPLLEVQLAVKRELVHHTERAAVVRRRDPDVAHRSELGGDELVARALMA